MITFVVTTAAVCATAAVVAFRRGVVLDRQAEGLRISGDRHAAVGEHVAAISARFDAFQASEQSSAAVVLAWCLLIVVMFLAALAAVS